MDEIKVGKERRNEGRKMGYGGETASWWRSRGGSRRREGKTVSLPR